MAHSCTSSNGTFVKIVQQEYEQRRKPSRPFVGDRWQIIALIGAGMGAETHLPLGKQAAKRIETELILEKALEYDLKKKGKRGNIRRRLRSGRLISERVHGQALNDLKQATGITGVTPDFEMQMEALCQGHAMEGAVRDELTKLYSSRYNVTLSYEILAHFFEHGILDGIINFNFDEQLDDAIERNLRPEQYRTVISDGDYVPNSTTHLYIKPHGTINHPSSLRFRKIDYSFIPEGILKAITGLLRGKTAFLVAGFGMQSIEFKELIRRRIDETRNPPDGQNQTERFEPHFFVINTDDDVERMIDIPNVPRENKYLLDCHRHADRHDTDPGRDVIPQLFADILDALQISKIVELRDTKYSKAVAHLFTNLVYDSQQVSAGEEKDPCDQSPTQSAWLPTYFYLRTAVALLAAIARQKGRINLEAQTDTRLGFMYWKYVARCREQEQPVRSLADMCQDLGLINYTYSRELFMVSTKKHVEAKPLEAMVDWLLSKLPRLVAAHGQTTGEVRDIAKQLTGEFCRRYNETGKEKLGEALLELTRKPSKEIAHPPKSAAFFVYPGQKKYIREVPHWDALTDETETLFNDSRWNELWVITEWGQWVFEDHWEEICKRALEGTRVIIRMVVKEARHMPKLRELRDKKIAGLLEAEKPVVERNTSDLEVNALPHWEHNRMLTCWLERNGDELKPLAAIYSHRGDRDTYISPVVIDAQVELNHRERQEADADLQNLVALFEAYRISAKAKEQPELKKKAGIVDEKEGCKGVREQIRTLSAKIRT